MECITSPFLYTLHLKVCLFGREHIDEPFSTLKNTISLFAAETNRYHIYPTIQPMARPIMTPTTGVHPYIILDIASMKKNTIMIDNMITL